MIFGREEPSFVAARDNDTSSRIRFGVERRYPKRAVPTALVGFGAVECAGDRPAPTVAWGRR